MNLWEKLIELGYDPESIPPDDNAKKELLKANNINIEDDSNLECDTNRR